MDWSLFWTLFFQFAIACVGGGFFIGVGGAFIRALAGRPQPRKERENVL